MQLLRCIMGGQAVLVENETVVEGISLESDLERLNAEQVVRFSEELLRLGQGVTGVGLVNSECLLIVTRDYFCAGRAPASGVKTIDRSPLASSVQSGARRFFVFGVPGALGFQFAVSMNQVLEVVRALPVAPLNFDHSHLAAVAVWRGEAIPVIDLPFAAKLGSLSPSSTWSRIMIVRNRANRVFAIPATAQVRQPAAASQVFAADSGSVRPMRGIRGVFRYEGSPLLVPDLDSLVG